MAYQSGKLQCAVKRIVAGIIRRHDRHGVFLRKAVIESVEPRILLTSYDFNLPASFDARPPGANPQSALVMDAGGNLFGTTTGGTIDNGTVFEIAKNSTTTTLAAFNGTNGKDPLDAVTFDSSGNLFGTTFSGGASGYGTVFEAVKDSGTITTLASFNSTDGAGPTSNVVLNSSGNLFGTTKNGGANGLGTVFEIAKNSTSITTVASFDNVFGADPVGSVTLDSNGDLFGTSSGDTAGLGTVFEVANNSTTITTIAAFSLTSFTDAPWGSHPEGGVTLDANGDLFGTTTQGGLDSIGTVFEIPHNSSTISLLASFNYVNGNMPEGSLILDSAGNLFGTTNTGAANVSQGSVFEIANGSSVITTVAAFSASGDYPAAGLVMDSAGNLFGTTDLGGVTGYGTAFEVVANSSVITTLASFNDPGGTSPQGALTIDSLGNLFGTTLRGGAGNRGTVFELARNGTTIDTLPPFVYAGGATPYGGVTLDSNGNLFGTTSTGGVNSDGAVFEIAKNGAAVTTVASFSAAVGAEPMGGVTFDSNGDLFGTTYLGGPKNEGTVFEIAKNSSTIVTLAAFNNNNGAFPLGNLAIDSSGNLFGIADAGGTSGHGTVFEVAKNSSTITLLAALGASGNNLKGGVTLDSQGDLFGTASTGGANNLGIVFEVVKGSSTITTVATFDSTTGANPYCGVTLDAAGDLFGTTYAGGADNDGTVFEVINGSNAITILHSFNSADGDQPSGGITLDSNGNLFGTTTSGGAENNGGVVFEISATSHPAFIQQPTATVLGNVIAPAVTVGVEDGAGAIVVGDTSSVTVSVKSGTGVLQGTFTAQAVNGIATFSNLSLSAAGTYILTATDGTPVSAASSSFVVSAPIVTKPVITAQPVAQSAIAGQNVSFTVAATGSPAPTVQWQVSTDGTTFNNVTGATSGSYSFTTSQGQNGNLYRAVFTNSQGSATTSSVALTVTPALAMPTVTTQPVTQTAAVGQTVNFTAAAGGNPNPTVQWQVSTNGTTYVNIPGATSLTYSFAATSGDNGYLYRAVFTNSQGTATSSSAMLTVSSALTAPLITTQPVAASAPAGQTASFNATASGNPGSAVQWQVSANGTSFTDVPGATSLVYSFVATASQNGNLFRAVFTNSQGTAATTAVALMVTPALAMPVITMQPIAQSAESGQTVSFVATASGTPIPTIQWQVSSDGSTFGDIAGATSLTYSFTAMPGQNGDLFRAEFTNALGSAQTNAVALAVTVPIVPSTAAITIPDVTSAGGAGQTITVVYTGSSGPIDTSTIGTSNVTITGPNEPLVVSSFIIGSASDNGNSVAVTYIVTPPNGIWQAADNGSYAVTVNAGAVRDTNGVGNAAASTSFSVNADAGLVVAVTSFNVAANVGQSVAFAADVTAPAGGTSPTGTVTFYCDGTEIGGPVTVSPDGTAMLMSDPLPLGNHAITAQYSGDGVHPAVFTGVPLHQIISPELQARPGLRGGLPKLVVAGQKSIISQSISISNSGSALFNGPVTVTAFLSTGITVDSNAIQLPNPISKQFRLKKTAHALFLLKLAGLPAGVTPGTYHLVVRLMGSGGQTSVAASAGTMIVQAPVIDLSGSFHGLPAGEKVGRKIGATLVVTNNGKIPARGPLLIVCYSSLIDTLDQTATELKRVTRTINLKPHKSVRVQLSGLAMSVIPGRYFLITQLDPNGVFSDVDPANNVLAGGVVVVG